LSNLGGALRARYDRAGEIADLNEAIDAVRTAAAVGGPNVGVVFLGNLSTLLLSRFARDADLTDLSEGIEKVSQALKIIRPGNVNYAGYQSILCAALWMRFGRTHNLDDLDEAIEAGRVAARSAPDAPAGQDTLHNLVDALLSRYLTGRRPAEELDEIIDLAGQAADSAPADHPHRVGYLLNLGTALEARFTATGTHQDAANAMASWRAACGIKSGTASERLNVARMWGRSAAEHGIWDEAEDGFAAAVNLLPLQAWHGLRQETREQVLFRRTGLASDAAAHNARPATGL